MEKLVKSTPFFENLLPKDQATVLHDLNLTSWAELATNPDNQGRLVTDAYAIFAAFAPQFVEAAGNVKDPQGYYYKSEPNHLNNNIPHNAVQDWVDRMTTVKADDDNDTVGNEPGYAQLMYAIGAYSSADTPGAYQYVEKAFQGAVIYSNGNPDPFIASDADGNRSFYEKIVDDMAGYASGEKKLPADLWMNDQITPYEYYAVPGVGGAKFQSNDQARLTAFKMGTLGSDGNTYTPDADVYGNEEPSFISFIIDTTKGQTVLYTLNGNTNAVTQPFN